jgi:hypothetical protein
VAPRRRDYAAEYARRQQRARQAGFGSYYQRRVAGVPKGERARVRGHRGRADFLASLREGDLIVCDITSVKTRTRRRRLPDRRFKSGYRVVADEVYTAIYKTVIPADNGVEREYVLRNLTHDELLAAIEEEEARGVVFSPQPSLDQRRLLK